MSPTHYLNPVATRGIALLSSIGWAKTGHGRRFDPSRSGPTAYTLKKRPRSGLLEFSTRARRFFYTNGYVFLQNDMKGKK
jgi:hypothetical protein